ncbi:MAG: hypothetical protein KDE51_26130 [Anaerolineales bacterium]|nr:hypothetical protein [Anaerolineales bacterium]
MQKFLPWLAFLVLLLWSWRTNLWTELPNYGDAIEVIWGSAWYRDALWSKDLSVFHYPLMFHPDGWQVGTLAHRPLHFLLYQPLAAIGGVVFAFNSFAILALAAAFVAAKRLFLLYIDDYWLAVTAALIYTFTFARFDRASGHVHVFVATAILPWLAYQIEIMKTEWEQGQYHWRRLVWVSLAWGGMINFLLYSIFWGALVFILLGQHLIRPKNWKYLLTIALFTIVFSLPSLIPYYIGSTISKSLSPTIDAVASLGLSLNNAPNPGFSHPLLPIRWWAYRLYNGPYDEMATIHFGTSTLLLALWGSYKLISTRQGNRWRIVLFGLSFVLALGVILKWNGQVLSADIMAPLNQLIWAIGHRLKPAVFYTLTPPEYLAKSIPLPSMWLLLFVPFWASARVMARYAFITLMMVIGLAAVGLQHLRRPLQIILVIIWVLEMWPAPTRALPFAIETIHPAYQWLAEQPSLANEAIVDLDENGSLYQAEILWATYLHHKPNISSVGSFLPRHSRKILSLLSPPYTDEQTLLTWQDVGVRYLLLHRQNKEATATIWQAILNSEDYEAVGCFSPGDQLLWPHEICIAKVNPMKMNFLPQFGWSAAEPWGVWTMGETAEARWIATDTADYTVEIEAFPNCVEDEQQTIQVKINEQFIGQYDWLACETWSTQLNIPAEFVNYGWNTITFDYNYAIRPIDVTNGENPDDRPLAVGFSHIRIQPNAGN